MEFYSNSIANDQKTTVVTEGQTNAAANGISEGTQTTTVVGPRGELVSRTVYNVSGGTADILLASETYTYPANDTFKLSPRVTYLDGTSSEVNYGCCGIDNTVDREGTTTSFTYDALKRQITLGRDSVTTSNVLDAAGQVLKTIRLGSDSSPMVLRQVAYDTAGRILKETNALNGVTTTSYFYDSQGQLVTTNTYPDGGTRIETYFLDGQLKSVTGRSFWRRWPRRHASLDFRRRISDCRFVKGSVPAIGEFFVDASRSLG